MAFQTEVVESYVRGTDLVVTYAPSADDEVSPQVCWRLLQPDSVQAAGVELILSVQTEQLDSDPSRRLASLLPVEELLVPGDNQTDNWEPISSVDRSLPQGRSEGRSGAFLFRLAGGQVSYLEMLHPSDCGQASIRLEQSSAHLVCSSYEIFADRLEKGVIRRGRLRGYFLPRLGDHSAAGTLYADFSASPPPLTT